MASKCHRSLLFSFFVLIVNTSSLLATKTFENYDIPENVAQWPEETDWKTAIEIVSNVACDMVPYQRCFETDASLKTEISGAGASVAVCQRACESDPRGRPGGGGLACSYDAAEQKCYACPSPFFATKHDYGNMNIFASVCREHHDFAYSSPVWDTTESDFGMSDKLELHGKNTLHRAYVQEYVTHVRLVMGGRTIEQAIYPLRQGKITLAELVTAAGGSIASETGVGGIDNWRGKPVSAYFSSGRTFCEHFGFNYLYAGGHDGGRSTGRDFAYHRARVRIGSVAGSSFPCGRLDRSAAYGVGLDGRYNRASFRVSSGYLDASTIPSTYTWEPAVVYVAAILRDTVASNALPFIPFGSLNLQGIQLQTFQVIAESHAPILNSQGASKAGIVFSPRMTYVFHYKIARVPDDDYYDDPSTKQIFKYGSTGAEGLPEVFLLGKTPQEPGASPNAGWAGNTPNGRQIDVRWGTTRKELGVIQNFDSWKVGDARPREWQTSLTIGRFHHIGVVIDQNSLILYLDGYVHAIYPLPPSTPATTKDVHVQDFAFRFLKLAETGSDAGNEIHGFRYFQDIALSGKEMEAFAAEAYPEKHCGDGIRNNGEICDDGNLVDGDGCSSACNIEPGYICRGGNTTSIAGDVCIIGNHAVLVTFDEHNYGGKHIDTRVYDVETWSKDISLPKLFDNVHVSSDGYVTERRGVTILKVGSKFGTKGNGLQVRFRNAWFTEEYQPNVTEQVAYAAPFVSTVPSSVIFAPQQRSAKIYLSNLSSHSLLRVTLKVSISGWSNEALVAIEIDNDLVFAHTAMSAFFSNTETSYPFLDSLKNGRDRGNIIARSTADDNVFVKTVGQARKTQWDYDSPFAWTFIDVTVPHVHNAATLTIRCVGAADVNGFKFDHVQYRTGSTSPESPFRPYVWDQVRNGAHPSKSQDGSSTYTWLQQDSPSALPPASWISFDFRILKIAQYNRVWAMTIMDAVTEYSPLSESCKSSSDCGSEYGCSACRPEKYFYRICYNPSTVSSSMPITGCDETQHPVLGIWHRETVGLFDKFASRYSQDDSTRMRKYRVLFSFLNVGDEPGGVDSEMEIHFDNVAFNSPTSYPGTLGCGSISVISPDSSPLKIGTGGVRFVLKNVSLALPTTVSNSGFCYVHIERFVDIDTSTLTAECGLASTFVNKVNTIPPGDRLLVASYGNASSCDNSCIGAIEALGGRRINWAPGASLALLGKKGKVPGDVIMAYAYSGEGGVNAKSILHCSDITGTLTEMSSSLSHLGPPIAFLDGLTRTNARFVLNPSTGGYLGCYQQSRYINNVFSQGSARALWFSKNVPGSPCFGSPLSTTPSTCAWCCGVHGFTLSGNNNYVPDGSTKSGCFCGDSMKQLQSNNRLLEAYCNTRCPNGLQTCGGKTYWYRAHAVFKTSGEKYLEKSDVVATGESGSIVNENKAYDNSRASTVTLDGSDSLVLSINRKVFVSTVRISSSDRSMGTTGWKLQYEQSTNNFVDFFNSDGSSFGANLTVRLEMFIVRAVIPIETGKLKLISTVSDPKKFQELYINYFDDMNDYKDTHYLRASKIAYGLPYEERAALAVLNHTVRTSGAQFKPFEYFSIDQAGQVMIRFAMLNFEGMSTYKLAATAFSGGLTKTFRMASQRKDGTPGYFTFDHGLGTVPGVVHVTVIPDTGSRKGYVFSGVGTVMGDEYYNEDYGGLLYAVSPSSIRLWAPRASTYFKKGYLVNLGPGWSGDNTQSHTGKVTVVLKRAIVPNYDSGWLEMRSNDPKKSFLEIDHGLSCSEAQIRTAFVSVKYRVKDKSKNNAYFEFDATGAQQADASGGRYGGIVYTYSTQKVRMWAPNYEGLSQRIPGFEIRYFNQSHALVVLDGQRHKTDNNYYSYYTTRQLKTGDSVIFRNTYASELFDGAHEVSSVIDPYRFTISPNEKSYSLTHQIQVLTTSTLDVNERQMIKLASQTSGISSNEKYELQRFQCNATSGTIVLTLYGGVGGTSSKTVSINAKTTTRDGLKNIFNALQFDTVNIDGSTCKTETENVEVEITGGTGSSRVCDNGEFEIVFKNVPGVTVDGGGNIEELTYSASSLSGQRVYYPTNVPTPSSTEVITPTPSSVTTYVPSPSGNGSYAYGTTSIVQKGVTSISHYQIGVPGVPDSNYYPPSLSISTVRNGTAEKLDGCFKMTYPNTNPVLVPVDANAAVMQGIFRSLGLVVSIDRVSVNENKNEFYWAIVFIDNIQPYSASVDGNIPSLAVDMYGVRGNAAVVEACTSRGTDGICNAEDSCDGSAIIGNFSLSFGGVETTAVDFDADSTELKTVIENALGSSSVTVSRSVNPVAAIEKGYIWTISFLENQKQELAVMNQQKLLTTVPGLKPTVEIYGLYANSEATYVQFPDPYDCGVGHVPCFRFDDVPDTDLQNQSIIDEVQTWGKCEIDYNYVGETCSPYPLRTSLREGKAMNVPVGRGWDGPPETASFEDDVEVRVKITLTEEPPVRTIGWRTLARGSRHHIWHHLDYIPERVKVVSKVGYGSKCNPQANCHSNTWDGFYYDAVGSAQATDFRRHKLYAGVVYAYSKNYIDFVAPGATSGRRINYVDSMAFSATDGWGTGQSKSNLQREQVQTIAYLWEHDTLSEKESVDIVVNVTDSNEPPKVSNIYTSIIEDRENGTVVGDLTPWDQDPHGAMKYSILDGNSNDAFKILPNGKLVVNRQSAINFEGQRFFGLKIKITDGLGSSATGYAGINIMDKNDLPRFCDPHPFVQGPLSKLIGISECDENTGGCFPKRPHDQQPLLNILERNVSEFATRGDENFFGRFNNGPICTYDDDIISGEPQNMYFSISAGNSALFKGKTFSDVFRIGYCDGKMTVMKSGALDFENIIAPSYYDLTIHVVDDGPQPEGIQQNATATLRIYAIDGNDKPQWPVEPVVITLPEEIGPGPTAPNTPIGNTLVNVIKNMNHTLDVDAGDSHTWVLKLISPDTKFNSNGGPSFLLGVYTGQVTAKNVRPNYEGSTNKYELSIEVTDSASRWGAENTHTVSGTVTIQVSDRNDAPAMEMTKTAFDGCSQNSYCRSVPENSPNGTEVTGGPFVITDEDSLQQGTHVMKLIGGPSEHFFRVSSTGILSVTEIGSQNLNFEEYPPKTHFVTVHITDSGLLADGSVVAPVSISVNVTITVTDVNETPNLSFKSLVKSIPENMVAETFLGTLIGIDPDNAVVAHQTLKYHLVVNDAFVIRNSITGLSCSSVYCVDSVSGNVSVAQGGIMNYEKPITWNATFQVTDDAYCSSTGSFGCETREEYQFDVTNQNDAPTFCTGNGDVCPNNLFINENNFAREVVGNFRFYDEDLDTLAYRVYEGKEISQLFIYDGQSLIVNASNSLNYEEKNVYNLNIEADDKSQVPPGPLSVKTQVIVNVNDVNEPPRWEGRIQNFSCNELKGVHVGEPLRKTSLSEMAVADDDTGSDKLTFEMVTPMTTAFNLTRDGHIILVGGYGFVPCNPNVTEPVTFGVKVSNRQGGYTVANLTVYPSAADKFQPRLVTDAFALNVPENAVSGQQLVTAPVGLACDTVNSQLLYSNYDPLSAAGRFFSVSTSNVNFACIFNFQQTNIIGKAVFLRSSAGGLNYESLASVDYKLYFQIKVADRDNLASILIITVNVQDENDAPCGHGNAQGKCPGLHFLVQENSAPEHIVGRVTNSLWHDEDGLVANSLNSTNANCEVISGNSLGAFKPEFRHQAGTDLFELVVQNRVPLNYEMHKSFNLTARVSDGFLYGTGQIIVSVLDMNEPPVLSSSQPLNISEVDSMHLFPNKFLCEGNGRGQFYHWRSDVLLCTLRSRNVARVNVFDYDDGAAVDFNIKRAMFHNHEGDNVEINGLFVLQNCQNKVSGQVCEVLLTSQTSKYTSLDAELYAYVDLYLEATEVSSTCSAFPNRVPPCERHSVEITLRLPILDINDVIVEKITLNTVSLLANSKGGDILTVEGHNFGRLNVGYEAFSISYAPLNEGNSYNAQNISQGSTNSVLHCATVSGTGRHQFVQITVLRTGHVSVSIPLQSSQTYFSYEPPNIEEVLLPGGVANTNGSSFLTIRGKHFGSASDWNFGNGVSLEVYMGMANLVKSGINRYKVVSAAGVRSRNRCTLGQSVFNFPVINAIKIRRTGSTKIHQINLLTSSELPNDVCYEESRWVDVGCWRFSGERKTLTSLTTSSNGLYSPSHGIEDNLMKCALAAKKAMSRPSYFITSEDTNLCFFNSSGEENMFDATEERVCDSNRFVYRVHRLTTATDQFSSQYVRVKETIVEIPSGSEVEHELEEFSESSWEVFGVSSSLATYNNFVTERSPSSVSGLYRALSGVQYRLSDCIYSMHAGTDELVCTVPPGVGKSFQLSIMIGGQISNAIYFGGYKTPTLKQVSVLTGGNILPTNSKTEVTITGEHFGPPGEWLSPLISGVVTYKEAGAREYVASDCFVDNENNNILRCLSQPGLGDNLQWNVAVGGTGGTRCGEGNIPGSGIPQGSCGGMCMKWGSCCVAPDFFESNRLGSDLCINVQTVNSQARIVSYGDLNFDLSIKYLGCWLIPHIQKPTQDSIEITSTESNPRCEIMSPRLIDDCAQFARSQSWVAFSMSQCGCSTSGYLICKCMRIELAEFPATGPSLQCSTVGLSFSGKAHVIYSILGVKRQESSWIASRIRYAKPELHRLEGVDQSPTTGGNTFIVHGKNFGPKSSGGYITLQYGSPDPLTIPRPLPFSAKDCMLVDDTQLRCKMAPGTGKGHSWLLSIGSQSTAQMALNTNYRPPVVKGFLLKKPGDPDNVQSFNTSGKQIIEIEGTDFGPLPNVTTYIYNINISSTWTLAPEGQSHMSTFMPSQCIHSAPHERIQCIIPEGVGRGIKWEITIDEQESVQPTTGYGRPKIHLVEPNSTEGSDMRVLDNGVSNVLTAGGDMLRIVGENFGSRIEYLDGLWYGCNGLQTYSMYDCITEIPHKQILCRTAAGVGTNLQFSIQVGGQMQDYSNADLIPKLSYARPFLETLSRNGDREHPFLGGTTYGQYSFRIEGKYFGTQGGSFSPISRGNIFIVFGRDEPILVKPKDVLVSNINREVLIFEVPEGQGERLEVKVKHVPTGASLAETSKCTQESSPLFYKYKLPLISRIKAVPARNKSLNGAFLVQLSIYGENVLDSGIFPNPEGIWDNGGSFGKDVQVNTKGHSQHNRVSIYRYIDQLEHAANLTSQQLSLSQECTSSLYGHNKIICDSNFENGKEVLGAAIIWVGWRTSPTPTAQFDGGNWWVYKDSGWSPVDRGEFTLIEKAFRNGGGTCSESCVCKFHGESEHGVIPNNASVTIRSFSLSVDSYTAKLFGGGETKMTRLCGQPSNPQIFSDVQPKIYDVCVYGGHWARKKTSCNIATTNGKFGDLSELSDEATTLFQSDGRLVTAGGQNIGDLSDNAVGRIVFIYGKHLVASGAIEKVSVEFLSPANEQTKLTCTVMQETSKSFYDSRDIEKNCNRGCTVLCQAPEGYGKNWRIRFKRGGLINAQMQHIVSYHPPLIDGISSSSQLTRFQGNEVRGVPTSGDILTIKGGNFGMHARVQVGEATPFINGDGECQCGYGNQSMVCHENLLKLPSLPVTSISKQSCFLRQISSDHSTVIVVVPEGVGRDLDVTLVSYNQRDQRMKLSFSPPQILSATPTILNTRGGQQIILKGLNFGPSIGAMVDVFSKTGNKTASNLRMLFGGEKLRPLDSKLCTQGQSLRRCETPVICVIEWGHSEIRFYSPEGDGVNIQLQVTAGNQMASTSLVSYAAPIINSINPFQDILSSGREGVKLHSVHHVTSDDRDAGLLIHEPFLQNHVNVDDALIVVNNAGFNSKVVLVNVVAIINATSFRFVVSPSDTNALRVQIFFGRFSGGFIEGARVKITVRGQNFGFRALNITIGNTALFHSGRDIHKCLHENSTTPEGGIIFRNHSTLIFYAVEGVGTGLSVGIHVSGNSRSVLNAISYSPPKIFSLTPNSGPTDGCKLVNWEAKRQWDERVEKKFSLLEREKQVPGTERKCSMPATIHFVGSSLGLTRLEVWVGSFQVCTNPRGCHAEGLTPYMGSSNEVRKLGLPRQTHNSITLYSPVGYGANLSTFLRVGGQLSDNVTFSFNKPIIDLVNPNPFDARGPKAAKKVELTITGFDFGGIPSPLQIFLNTAKCKNPVWRPRHTVTGFPYVQCSPPEMVAGPKSAVITVAGQFVTESFDALQPKFVSMCKQGEIDLKTGKVSRYYGRIGELCAACPSPGAICNDSTFNDPISQVGFWREDLDIKCNDISDDGFFCKAYRNKEHSTRAKFGGLQKKGSCPPERYDLSLKKRFPDLIMRDTCFNFAGCIPSEACSGNNDCELGYEYQRKKCRAWESSEQRGKPNSGKGIGQYVCETDADCRTRSGLPDRPLGRECGLTNPEDCSVCKKEKTANGTLVGHCECAPPTRCSLCTFREYYRTDNACEPCPEQPGLIFALFGVAIVGALVGSYVLNSYNFNMAFISIGVDYFQVLALFSRAKIEWPDALKSLLKMFTIFNFNIDVTAPECLFPDFDYENKWYAIMLLPIGCMCLVFVAFIFIVIRNLILKTSCRMRDMCANSSMVIATMITLMYYMYLMLVRRVFDVYNCSENPVAPDGRVYAPFTSIKCDGGVCACWEWDDPRSIQLRLFRWTIPGILVYVIGFPLFLLVVLRCNKAAIKEDQILRAHGLGSVESENPFSFLTRQRFHRIYYHFKPGKTYWMVYIVLRKFVIALVGVVFRENSGYQLSFTMLLLFVCYIAQQKHLPYMSSMERRKVVADHAAKVKEGNKLHMSISDHIQSAKENQRKRKTKDSVRSRRMKKRGNPKTRGNEVSFKGGVSLDSTLTNARNFSRVNEKAYFFDYNTVESVLLACAIMVCLAGTMIESGNFRRADGSINTKTVWQRDLIGVLITIVVLTSIVYYATVFASELGLGVPATVIKCFAKKKGSSELFSSSRLDEDNGAGDIELSINPLHGNKRAAADVEKFKEISENQAANQKLLLEKLRQAQQTGGILGSKSRAEKRKIGRKKKVGKQEFRTSDHDNDTAPLNVKGVDVQWTINPLDEGNDRA